MRRRGNVFRDGKVHVQLEMCGSCVFRPGNQMHLRSGALRQIVDGNLALDTPLICHQTLAIHPDGGNEAVCRGFFERYPTTPMKLAETMGLIEWVTVEDSPMTTSPQRDA